MITPQTEALNCKQTRVNINPSFHRSLTYQCQYETHLPLQHSQSRKNVLVRSFAQFTRLGCQLVGVRSVSDRGFAKQAKQIALLRRRTSLICCDSFAYSQRTSDSSGDKLGWDSYGLVSNIAELAMVFMTVLNEGRDARSRRVGS